MNATTCQRTPNTTALVTNYHDTSTECGICLLPYDEDETKTTIELSCGHKWHLECVREQLAHATPTKSQRLVFRGCRCAKCGVICNHPALRDVSRPTDALRHKVDRILAEHLKLVDSSGNFNSMLDNVRDKYVFYLCSSCEEPYLVGNFECVNDEEDENKQRLCSSCNPRTTRTPANSPTNASLIWKCRYCCSPSTHLCNDSVHMCDNCHERSIHLHEGLGYHVLEALPCPGGNRCPYPKPRHGDFHANGPYAFCEQIYSCESCYEVTDPNTSPDGSHNLLVNPCGKEGFNGWRRLNGIDSWEIESSAVPLCKEISTNFVSSHFWCSMEQIVDLTQAVTDPTTSRVEVSASFMGREECPSVFRLQAEILDATGQTCRKISTRILSAPTDFWERASLVLEPTAKAHSVKITVHGKDGLLWRGHYGSKVTNCSVRIMGNAEPTQHEQ